MTNTQLNDYNQLYILLKHCDYKKVYYRQKNNRIAEKMFAYFEFKIGMLVDHISMALMEDEIHGSPIVPRCPDNVMISVTDAKIKEIQTLIITHYISIVESSLREKIVKQTKKKKKILLNDILIYMHKKEKITDKELYLWTGIRHIRNAIVHYDSKPTVSMKFKYKFKPYELGNNFTIKLVKDDGIFTQDLFQDFRVMQWITYNVERMIK